MYALGELNHYGKNGNIRGENCRTCPHAKSCKFYSDILASTYYKQLYVDNEKYDGYLRDGCVFKNDVNIFDKMAATIRYANSVQVSYSLTAYSPYEGYRIAFNGTKGREVWAKKVRRSLPLPGLFSARLQFLYRRLIFDKFGCFGRLFGMSKKSTSNRGS